MKATTVRRLEVVLKVTERCNINCTYCYFFNKSNNDYDSHPARISKETVEDLAQFLEAGIRDLGLTTIRIVFHGGEPLLLKPAGFEAICDTLRDRLSEHVSLSFVVQTNAMLVSDAWIEVFRRNNVGVGVSLDGPKKYHDLYRVDHQGRGTYDRVVAGINLLMQAAADGRIPLPGAIAVINPDIPIKEVFRHLVDELGFRTLNFRLPLDSHETFESDRAADYAKSLIELYDEWAAHQDGGITLDIVRKPITQMLSAPALVEQIETFERTEGYRLITVASDGSLSLDDQMLLDQGKYFFASIKDCSLAQFFAKPQVAYLMAADWSVPDKCAGCCWQNMCRGGSALGNSINRFSSRDGLNNKSIVCESLRPFFKHMYEDLAMKGASINGVTNNLKPRHPIHNELDARWTTVRNSLGNVRLVIQSVQ